MALGILAGWGMVMFGLSYYVRDRIGIGRWKVLHRFTALAWILGVIHTLGEGSDAGRPGFLAMTALARRAAAAGARAAARAASRALRTARAAERRRRLLDRAARPRSAREPARPVAAASRMRL